MSTGLQIFTAVHTLISLVAIVAGCVVMSGLIRSKRRDAWTAVFLGTAAATTVTGFFFPFHGPTPAIILGVISLVPLTFAFLGRYRHRLAGAWRWIYVVSACVVLYFSVFVLVVQSFQKVPGLHALTPTESEPPFKVTQLTVLILFVVLTVVSTRNFHVEDQPSVSSVGTSR